ncbi:hypothetical protein SKAU_G00093470 [Synaphobranchus kaupii]|uniref:Uncharacterized protein n=1 Tax=Synaphobranchus kaupii TaxID=118154 RepID=A0A9Q1J6E7_SYNKA|nr:hypothetical protein SKAU_G00093470 [Synaphobranchus kaupii]
MGSLPRQAPSVPFGKPRDGAVSGAMGGLSHHPHHLGLSQVSLSSTGSPRPSRGHPDPLRRGSFVERCQELAKSSEPEGGRRSLASPASASPATPARAQPAATTSPSAETPPTNIAASPAPENLASTSPKPCMNETSF